MNEKIKSVAKKKDNVTAIFENIKQEDISKRMESQERRNRTMRRFTNDKEQDEERERRRTEKVAGDGARHKKKDEQAEEFISQLAKLRYCRRNIARDIPTHYEGLKLWASGKTTVVPMLNPDWVERHWKHSYLAKIRNLGRKAATEKQWNDIPSGAASDCEAPAKLWTKFRIKYYQGEIPSCLWRGFASALHYMGNKELASHVSNNWKKYMDLPTDQQLQALVTMVAKYGCTYQVTKYLTKARAIELDILRDESQFLWIVVPLGMDGGVQHAITIHAGLVFDSTQQRVLQLSKETLDWSCEHGGYARVYKAVRFSWKI